jgi:hypothetical protein
MGLAFLRRGAVEILAVSAVLSVVGCGGRGSPAVQSGNVVIFEQPTSQTVPIGRTATFTAAAETTPSQVPVDPVTYQWSKNGVAIPGATASSYTTPTITLADSGTQYMVTASSGSNSVNSAVVTLTAGPRAPAIGDVRYLLWQQVNVPWYFSGSVGFDGQGFEWIYNALGTPLPVGNGASEGCLWEFSYNFVPSSMDGQFTMYYEGDPNLEYRSWQSYLESLNDPNIVIESADLEPACYAMVVSWIQVAGTQPGGFDYKLEEVPASEVSATIANDGNASRIVTAVIYDSVASEWALISYGWQGDRTTVYESQAAIVPNAQVWSEAQTLASQGYFLSAYGGDDTDGYLLVGMRVQGDTLPRPIQNGTGPPAGDSDSAYWSWVMWNYPMTIAEQ